MIGLISDSKLYIAGIPLSKVAGTNTSVHVGCFSGEYESVLYGEPEVEMKYLSTGTGSAMLANRVSWFYDFRGPSMTVDTACSSSLIACHLACQALKSGESSVVSYDELDTYLLGCLIISLRG